MKLIPLAALTLLLACGGGQPYKVLDITELTFSQDGNVVMHLSADGHFELKFKPVSGDAVNVTGTVTADGTFMLTSVRGPTSMHLGDDGKLNDPDGRWLGPWIDGDTLVLGGGKATRGTPRGRHIMIDHKGELVIDDTVTPVVIQGVTTLKSRRTALVLVALLLGAYLSSGAAPAS